MKRTYLFLALFAIISCHSQTQQDTKEPLTNKVILPQDLVGKIIAYKYGESIYHVTIDSETDLHWEAIAGEEKGAYEEEKYKIAAIDDQKLFITWGEANGIGVSQVLDFEKGIVFNHLLRGRDVSIGTGTIKLVD